MGEKGAKQSGEVEAASSRLVAAVTQIGDVTSRKMFGGVGVFESGTMFGIVDSAGGVFFRAGPQNQQLFEEAGSTRHGRMPYYSVPEDVLGNPAELRDWATRAVSASRTAKK